MVCAFIAFCKQLQIAMNAREHLYVCVCVYAQLRVRIVCMVRVTHIMRTLNMRHSGKSRTQSMLNWEGERARERVMDVILSNRTCCAVVDAFFAYFYIFFCIAIDGTIKQIEKFRWYNSNSSCDRSFRHVDITHIEWAV